LVSGFWGVYLVGLLPYRGTLDLFFTDKSKKNTQIVSQIVTSKRNTGETMFLSIYFSMNRLRRPEVKKIICLATLFALLYSTVVTCS
jgi:hypothetical protein